jgi:hypothetical protein
VFAEVVERFEVRIEPFLLRIRDKHHTVGAFQNQFAAGFVEDLPGHSVKMNPRLESANRAEVDGKKIKKERAVSLRRKGDHLPFLSRPCVVVDPLQVGGLTAQTWAVVHELAINFASRKIDKGHKCPDGPERLL